MDRSFGRDIGYLYEDYWLPGGESINFEASTTVDKEGEWIFLPAYSSRTDEGDIVHTTCMVESDYANHEIGEYLAVRHFGTEYMAINGKPNVLSPILMEMDEDEKQTLRTGENWELGGGYSLVAEQINLEGDKVWLSLQKDGKELESSVIGLHKSGDRFYNRMSITGFPMAYDITTEDVSTTSTFVYQRRIGYEDNVPIFSVYVDTAFRGTDANIVQLKYAILIGDLTRIDTEPDYACYLDVVSPAQPDLTVEEIFWNPAHPKTDEPVTVAVVVRNIGDPSGGVYLTLGGCCDLTSRVPPLKSGERTTIYFEPIIFEEPGEFEITAAVDASNEISESNEENNERSEIITVEEVAPNIPPTAHIRIYPNPVDEGESVTFEGWGEDEDGEVVECRWTLHDGSIRPYSGSSSRLTLEPDEVVAGWYAFAVGEELEVETEFPTKPIIPVVLATIAVLAAGALLVYYVFRKPPVPKPNSDMEETKDENESEEDEDEEQHGSIRATSDPSDAVVFVDGAYNGRSPKKIDNVLIGPHTVLFLKRGYFGYEKNAIVVANQTTPIHRDLTKMPEVKLKLSADPAEIVADGKSRSMIKIEIATKDDNEIPIPVPEETTVILETDIGTIESPVKIPRGRASVTSTLISTSPASRGTATVKAEAEYGKIVKLTGSTTVEFSDAESG
jgi:hypothetical protein